MPCPASCQLASCWSVDFCCLKKKKHQGDGVEKYEKPVSPPKIGEGKKGLWGEVVCVIFCPEMNRENLAGGFKCFLFSPLLGKMIQFD